MLKILLVHLIGGGLSAVTIGLAEFVPESIRLGMLIAVSVLMTAYYVWMGAFLKDESLTKIIIIMQVAIYIGGLLIALGDGAYIISYILIGGSGLWVALAGEAMEVTDLVLKIGLLLMFFAFPFPILLGRKIAGKGLKPDIKKELTSTLKILVCSFTASAVYPVASSFINKKNGAGDILTASISLFAVMVILFVGGIALRKISRSRIFFVMLNCSLLGIIFTLDISKELRNVLIGSERTFKLFFETVIGKYADYIDMLLIPPLIVIMGCLAGNSIMKNKQVKRRPVVEMILIQLIGGLIVFYSRELASLLNLEAVRMGAYAAISVLMAAYYVWMGAFFKDQAFGKLSAVVLIMTFIGVSTTFFETDIYRYTACINGAGSIWSGVLSRFFPDINYLIWYPVVGIAMVLLLALGYIGKRKTDIK